MNKITRGLMLCAVVCIAGGPPLKSHLLQNLEDKAKSALKAGDNKSAAKYASELVNLNDSWIPLNRSWNYGDIVYEGNQILGLAALKEGNVTAAKQYLLAAGHTPGSPVLDSFGPELTLAQELLKMGEKQVVLDFLDLIAKFWATPKAKEPEEFAKMDKRTAAKIQQWKDAIHAGKPASLDRFEFP